MKKQGWLLFFLLTLCVAASSSEAQNPEPEATVISVGKIDATWKGVLSIPIWAETNVFFVGTTPVVLPEDVKAFKLKVDWLGNNQTRLDEESSVIMKVEAEDPPFSGNWKMVFEKNEAVGCKKHSSFQKIILSDPVVQEKPEVRYKISLSSILSVGPRSGPKETYLTVKLSSIAYDTYTTIPFISLAILHDPNGDHSWSGIKASSCLLHLLSLQTGNRPVSINNQKELLFHDPKGSFRVKSNNKENYLEISFFPTIDITSEQTSEDSCLIGPGLGDVYLLARNLPIKLSLVETFSAKAKLSKLFFTIVSPEEAGLGPDKKFEILVVPAASLRFFEEGKPVFGTWQQYGITDSFREQLIKMNSGWDNVISPYEKDSSKYLGEAFLNSKDKTPIRWNQEILLPITIDSGIDVLPSFVEKLQLSLPDNNIPMSIIMNSKPYAKSTIPEDVVLSLEDNEQGGKFPNFFVFDAYLDKYFGTPLFITKDDKTTPADTRSLRMRSISSSPQEFWTGSYETPVISGQITTIEGKTLGGAVIYLKQKDTVVRKGISSPDGFYKISVPSDEEQYSLLVQCEGCEDVIIPAVAFSADKRDVVKNVSLPVAREQLAVDSRQSAVGSQQLTEKATVTTKPVAVVSEKATVTTKPAVVVPEKATTTIKPAPTVEEKPVEFTGIIKNGSFSSDTMCWNILKVGSGQIMNVSVLNDSDKYPHALDI
ncbi:MAG: carboxypeptidase-like regulatory domain-containing protein, partial [Candidatus Desantisbacteria bacterium]